MSYVCRTKWKKRLLFNILIFNMNVIHIITGLCDIRYKDYLPACLSVSVINNGHHDITYFVDIFRRLYEIIHVKDLLHST